jgi:hypothetical protein
MKKFYKLNPLEVGSGTIIPDDFIVYTNDNIPSELQEALDAETVANELSTKIAEAKAYLASTDFKVLPDYDKEPTEVIAKRAEAREFIRANQGVTDGL